MSDRQLAAIAAEFDDLSHPWVDSLNLDFLLAAAHTHGVLPEVVTYQLLDEDDRDLFLISVELSPGIHAHAAPTYWCDVRPPSDLPPAHAIRHLLEQLDQVAKEVRARFLTEVAEIVSAAVMDQAE